MAMLLQRMRLWHFLFLLGLCALQYKSWLVLPRHNPWVVMTDETGPPRYAYLTLLCDDVMADAAMVLVQSLKNTKTEHDIVVLAYKPSEQTLQSLRHLGAIIETIRKPVPYPFTVTDHLQAINKPCRYSKLLMWTLEQYQKIVYLDGDLLVLQNIDELFQRPELSAAPDPVPPDRFNSGVMVIEPSQSTFQNMLLKAQNMPSPNMGDQGFLNNYFPNWFTSGSEHHLNCSYNALVRTSSSPLWKEFVDPNLKVIHFSGKSKPWNTMVDEQFPTSVHYDELWWRVHHQVYTVLSSPPAAKPSPMAGRQLAEGESVRAAEVQPSMEEAVGLWRESVPQLQLQCGLRFMANQRRPVKRGQVSVVLRVGQRASLIQHMIDHYDAMGELVDKIYLAVDHSVEHLSDYSTLTSKKPLAVLSSHLGSPNDRFRPIESLETACVLLCDDGIEVSVGSLKSAYARWLDNPMRLVGFVPAAHYQDAETGELGYVADPREGYSMVQTRVALMHATYLQFYSCSMQQSVRDYIDSQGGCEDIALNLLVAKLSGFPPLLVQDHEKIDYGPPSVDTPSPSACLNKVAGLLGYMPLRNISTVVAVHQRHPRQLPWWSLQPNAVTGLLDYQLLYDNGQRALASFFMAHLPSQRTWGRYQLVEAPGAGMRDSVVCIRQRKALRKWERKFEYAVSPHFDVGPEVEWLSGPAWVVHFHGDGRRDCHWADDFLGFLARWRADHSCFAPMHLLFFRNGGLQRSAPVCVLGALQETLGEDLVDKLVVSGVPEVPVCFSELLVLREPSQPDSLVMELPTGESLSVPPGCQAGGNVTRCKPDLQVCKVKLEAMPRRPH